MSTFNRLKKIVSTTIEEVKMNSEVSKVEVYEHFYNKFNNTQLNASYLLNENDYHILQNFSNKNNPLSSHIIEYLSMHKTIHEAICKIDIMNLQSIYQSSYNFLVMMPKIQYKHIYVPPHIKELDDELANYISASKQLMLFMFGSLRQMLQTGLQVFYKEPYCNPQVSFRQLESLKKPNFNITTEHQQYIDTIMRNLREHFQQLLNILSLIKEQTGVLIMYYKDFYHNYNNSIADNNFIMTTPDSPYFNQNIENRKQELRNLKEIYRQN